VDERIADIDRARDAVARAAWPEAYEEFRALDPSTFTPEDLEGIADAAWWLCKMEESIATRQKCYASYAAAGDRAQSGFVAVRLCIEHFLRGDPSVGAGWLSRAREDLRDEPEGFEHGFLALIEATVARFSGELDAASVLAKRATQIGRRFGHRDLIAMAIHTEGLVLIAQGQVPEGMAFLDRAMTSVISGELSDYYTGAVYCNVLEACLQLADLRRAGEWSEAARAWCDSLAPGSPYPGICRINRAQIAVFQGAWPEAEAEAVRASQELMSFDSLAAGSAFYETGEIRRRIGNDAGAEEAFGRAHEIGFEPQPGLALLRLAQGKSEAALNALRLALGGESQNRVRRARLLSALVEVALAAQDLETAAAADLELEAIARAFPVPVIEATAATSRGAVRLGESDIPSALQALRRACSVWQELRLPYETARARMAYGLALRAAGDEEDARLELRAARSAFERLGAVPDADAVDGLLGEPGELPRGLTAREVAVLRLVAAGKTNREVAHQLVISEHTVARHLQNIFAKLDVSSRSAATAFAFEHDLA
jgi:ATP/maltotriose-dependent transcriptional regulator MalT